jgi:cell filamentation protein, protein adenylyltransferase
MPRWDVRFDLAVDFTSAELIRTVTRAEALADVIAGIPIPPYLRAFLDRLNIHRAVRGTTGIEGSDLTQAEVDRVLEAPDGKRVLPKAREREEQETRNADTVFRFVADLLVKEPGRPVTENLICEIHRLTTQDISYPNNVPGQYRSHAVSAGSYLAPATGEEVRRLMPEFVDWLNDAGVAQWPPLVRAIVAHFYLISIHPFGDGNGRTARAVESYLLYQSGVNACGFYSLSNFYYQRRQEYEAMLDHVRFQSHGNLTPFVMFAATGLVEELETVHSEVFDQVTLIAFRDYAREQLMRTDRLGTKAGDRMFHFLLELAVAPVTVKELRSGTHPLAAHYKRRSAKTLLRDIGFLEENELIVRDGDRIAANLGVMETFKIGRSQTASATVETSD